jgi:hypothetical protein
MLEALSKLDNISLEELDLTVDFIYLRFIFKHFSIQGSSFNPKQISDIDKLFSNHPKFTCYVGAIRHTTEHFANNLVNLIHIYCRENQVNLKDLFGLLEEIEIWNSTITYNQFLDGLKKAKIPFPVAQIENIMKYLVSFFPLFAFKTLILFHKQGQESDPGTIPLRFEISCLNFI